MDTNTNDSQWYALAIAFGGILLSVSLSLIGQFVHNQLRSPKLKILHDVSQPFDIDTTLLIGVGNNHWNAIRLKVENKQKWLLNSAAENCLVWLDLEGAPESYRLRWVGGEAVTINVGDVREIDFLARGRQDGRVIAPTERGYFKPKPREMADGKTSLKGKIRVTSSNGKRAEEKITICPKGKDELFVHWADL